MSDIETWEIGGVQMSRTGTWMTFLTVVISTHDNARISLASMRLGADGYYSMMLGVDGRAHVFRISSRGYMARTR